MEEVRTKEQVYADIQARLQETEKPVEGNEKPIEGNEKPVETNTEQVKESEKPVEPVKPEITDDAVLMYLKDKGVEVSSFDELNKKPFASTEVEEFNKFVEQTGRDSLDDYLKVKKDIDNISDVEIAREKYLLENPGATKEDFDVLYDLDLKPLDPDTYTEEQVAERDRAIRKRDALIKLEGSRAKDYFKQLQEQIKTPVQKDDRQAQAEAENQAWKENISKALESLDLGVDGFNLNADKQTLADRYGSIENVVNSFKDESGNFNYNEFITALEFGRNRQNILNHIKQQGATQATEEILKTIEKPSEVSLKETQSTVSEEMQQHMAAARAYIDKLKNF